MKKVSLAVLMILSLASCATHKIETSSQFPLSKLQGENPSSISSTKLGEPGQGVHCFEPMLHILTLGIVPTHCIDEYQVKLNDEPIGDVKVTTMSGWIPLLMNALPKWKYGSRPNIAEELTKAAD